MAHDAGSTINNLTDEWHIIDARDQVLGRLATKIAALLNGKLRTDYAANTVAPVYVVVTNTDHVVLTGNKENAKMYRHYTGYPGGLRERSVREQRVRDSRVIIEQAVFGMLPKNNLRAVRIRHLKLYVGDEHPHQAQMTKSSAPA